MAELKPMEAGEVLDGTFTLYGRHFWLFLQLSMAVMWLPIALGVYFRLRFMAVGPELMFTAFQDHAALAIVLGAALLITSVIAQLLLTAGSIHIISASFLGRTPTLREALGLGASRILRLFLVSLGKGLLLFLIIMGGGLVIALVSAVGGAGGSAVTVLFIIAAVLGLGWFLVYVASGYGITTPVVVLEDLESSFDAFGRSWELTRSFKPKVAGLWFVGYLIATVPGAIVSGVGNALRLSTPAWEPAVVVASAVVPIVLAPVVPCVLTLIYYDLRVRREAFDLQVLGQQLGII